MDSDAATGPRRRRASGAGRLDRSGSCWRLRTAARRPSRDLHDAAIDSLLEAVGPLGDQLGEILAQLPPYVVSGDRQREQVEHIVSRVRPARAASWVVVDAPRIDAKNVMRPIVEVTSPQRAYLRLHGRNAADFHGRGA